MQQSIVVTGSIAIDRIMGFGGSYRDLIKPDKLDSLSFSVLLDSLQDSYGGVGANIAYSLALLGEKPILLGSVGKDGLVYMERLAKEGVDITHIHESTQATATFSVITDKDQNQIGGFYPGAMYDSQALSLAPWKDGSAIIVVSPHDPKAMKRQVAEAKQWGLTLCYDPGQQVSNLPKEDLAAGVDAATILLLNEYEMSVLSDKIGRSVTAIKTQVPIVVTTLGKSGSVIEGASIRKPPRVGIVSPQKVIDPTGAGDAFRAGFLYGFVRQWPLKTCAQIGAACATYAVESSGTQSHRFTFDSLAKRYRTSFNEPLPGNQ